MENRAHALIARVFVFALAGAAIAAAVWLSRESGRYKPYLLVARSPVSGLNPEAQVRLRGVAVGKVASIRFDSENPLQIRVRIEVEEATPLTDAAGGAKALGRAANEAVEAVVGWTAERAR